MPAVSDASEPGIDEKGPNSARRQQVIDAAAATFSRIGYHGASTRAIADTLGFKVASLYFHIASKEDALEEICALGTRRALLYLEKSESESDTLSEQIRHFFRRQRDDLVVHADYVSVAIYEGRHLPAEAKARVGVLSREFRARVDAMFDQAASRGQLHPAISPRQARFVLIGTLRSISQLYVGGGIRDFDEIMSSWVEATIRGLVAPLEPLENHGPA